MFDIPLALVVPFHNEEGGLPKVIETLRNQNTENISVVFVDNASTDGSRWLMYDCEEIRSGGWKLIREGRVGKFYAMETGTAFCVEQLRSRYVGFLDGDSYYADCNWLNNAGDILHRMNRGLGYIFSPYVYFGFEAMPNFQRAYLAYERTGRCLMEHVGWFGNAAGAVFSAKVLTQYFRTAEITPEQGLRLSLLALFNGRHGIFNPSPIMSSGRRIVVNATNFELWCFYRREFYLKKDINSASKKSLNAPDAVEDLSTDEIDHFFERQAVKIACRNLIPLAAFDKSDIFLVKLEDYLGFKQIRDTVQTFRAFAFSIDFILTKQFDELLGAIELDPYSIAISDRIADLMRERYSTSAPQLEAIS